MKQFGRQLQALRGPYYPKAGKDRHPRPLSAMLRIHFMQQWFAHSDPATGESLQDIPLLREFAGLDATVEAQRTLVKFRHLLERHGLAEAMLDTINRLLGDKGYTSRQGTSRRATPSEGRCGASRTSGAPAIHLRWQFKQPNGSLVFQSLAIVGDGGNNDVVLVVSASDRELSGNGSMVGTSGVFRDDSRRAAAR